MSLKLKLGLLMLTLIALLSGAFWVFTRNARQLEDIAARRRLGQVMLFTSEKLALGKLIAQSNLPDKNNAIARVVDDVFLMQAAVNTNLRIEKRTEIATSLRDIQTSLSTISLLLQDLRARAATGQALTQEDVLRLDQLDAIVSKVETTVTEYDQYLNAEEKQIKKTANLFTNIIVAAMVATLIALFLIVFFNILSPINALTRSAQEITQGNYAHATNLKSKDELGQLGNAFDTMTSRLREFIGTLETRVAERTRNLELAAEVGRSVSQVRDLDVMLREAVEIIRSRFNLYYAQVYLANPTQTTLTLRSGTGTVGAELTARGHSLPINSASINGRAAVEKRPVVISDTAASPSFHPNALLPDTRSEMAVPLIINDRVVGVLDMQSDRAGALNQEILPAFEALAGQLAVAVQNANLLEEAEQARAEVEKQAARLVHAQWQDYLDAIHKPEQIGFAYEQNRITPLSETEAAQPLPSDSSLSAPIAVGGETLGSLAAELNEQSKNPQARELINAVARQVARQVENLRLLENAERYRAEAEQASRRLTREGWQEYAAGRKADDLGFLYDLKEVRPHESAADLSPEPAAVALPIKVREEAIGSLAVQGLNPADAASLELVATVAERLGAHIENLRQYDRAQSALTQTEKLFEASRDLSQAGDLQELTAAVVAALDIPEINRAVLAIFNYDADNQINSLDIIANWWNGTGTEITPVGTHYPREVIRAMSLFVSPTPVFFDDTHADERVDAVTMQLVQRQNLRAVAILPLHSGARQIGAVILEAEEPHKFTSEETRLFTSLAPQIATVLENRRQFERAQKQAERESALNLISQKIQSATSVESVLQIAARELGHALGAPLTIAQLGVKERGDGGQD